MPEEKIDNIAIFTTSRSTRTHLPIRSDGKEWYAHDQMKIPSQYGHEQECEQVLDKVS